MRNEIRDSTCSPMGEYTSTEVNAKNFKIPASKKSGNLAEAVSVIFSSWEFHSPENKKVWRNRKVLFLWVIATCLQNDRNIIHITTMSTLVLEDWVSLYFINLQGKPILFPTGMLVNLGGSQYLVNYFFKTAIHSINKYLNGDIGRTQVFL